MNSLSYVPFKALSAIRQAELPWQAKTQLLADCCRINALYMIQRAGSGHIGSSFSAMDIVAYLMLNRLQLQPKLRDSRDVYFSSKGHDAPGLYAVLIALGYLPFEKLHELRRLNGLPGHPDHCIPYLYTNTGSLGMGISKAKGLLQAKRLRKQPGRVVVMTGDGELQEGQFWESLISAANHNMAELCVIVDHNKIQSDTWVEKVSDLGALQEKFEAFGWYCEQCDGHDPQQIDGFMQRSAVVQKPQVLIAQTQKGKGVAFMDYATMACDAHYPYHSGALDQQAYKQALEELLASVYGQAKEYAITPIELERRRHSWPVARLNCQSLPQAYAEQLVRQAQINPDVLVLDADLALDCGLMPFIKRFPERFIECGIAEQDMVSQAGGLALQGFIPVVHSFACFLSARPNEQIYNNATEGGKIIYVASLAGLLPAGPGHSHQAVRDIAALAAVPGLVMIAPSSCEELALIIDFAVNVMPVSTYIRLESVPVPVEFTLPVDYRLHLGRGAVLQDGNDAVLFAYGPVLLAEAWQAVQHLQQQYQLKVKLINLPWLNRIDDEWLAQCCQGFDVLVTLDNHYVQHGQGEMIASRLALSHFKGDISHLGLAHVPSCGRNDEVLQHHGLDFESIAAHILHKVHKTTPQQEAQSAVIHLGS